MKRSLPPGAPAILDNDIVTFDPAEVCTRAATEPALKKPMVGSFAGSAPARRERPCGCRAAEQCDEVAPFHVEHGDFLPYALLARQPTRALGFPQLSLPQRSRLVLGADLNRSESRR